MNQRCSPNIGNGGRLLRGLAAAALMIGAWFAFVASFWLSLLLGLSSLFVLFEALRGWCALRACGIKTRF